MKTNPSGDSRKNWPRENAQSKASIVVSALFTNGAGKEIALKLEENSWSAIGRALDYQEVMETGLPADLTGVLVMVDATCTPRLDEALEVMEQLHRKRIKFFAVGLEHRQEERIDQLSGSRCIFLSGLKINAMQPLLTLVFYYQLAFYYGQSHGIALDVAPRNLAKSMTVGRSLFAKADSPARELLKIKTLNERLKASDSPPAPAEGGSIWEQTAVTIKSRQYYEGMRRLAAIISSNGLSGKICRALDENTNRLAHYLFDANSDIDEIVFAPMDRASEQAVKNAARIWSCILGYPVRIISPRAPLDAFEKNILLFTAASSPAGRKRLAKRLATVASPVFRLEPETGFQDHTLSPQNGGIFLLKNGFGDCRSDYLYAAIHLIFIKAWRMVFPGKAEIVGAHFRKSAGTIIGVLGNPDFKAAVSESMAVNRKYKTMFYIGPPAGIGPAWSDKFDRAGTVFCEPHLFGESSHGPLVTVDSRVECQIPKNWSKKCHVGEIRPGKSGILGKKLSGRQNNG